MRNNEHFLILADGNENFLSKERLRTFLIEKIFVVLDGACRIARSLDLVPDIILGDMDSVDCDTLKHFQKLGSLIVPAMNQNFSDMEKGIIYCQHHLAKSITILNACYGRMDHGLANIFFLKKYYNKQCSIRIFTEDSCIFYLRDESIDLCIKNGTKCGFFGFPSCIISVDGVRYKLDHQVLELGEFESIANEFITENVHCSVIGDCLVTYEI